MDQQIQKEKDNSKEKRWSEQQNNKEKRWSEQQNNKEKKLLDSGHKQNGNNTNIKTK